MGLLFADRSHAAVAAATVVALAACHGSEPAGPCTCAPANTIKSKAIGETEPMSVLANLRKHVRDVAAGRNPRDIKILDDQLRFAVVELCQPCTWVDDRMTMEQLFPLARLDDAVSAVCMGLVLRDGSTAYGDARPANCR